MFDTMTMTKVVGAVCGTLLVFLLGSWAAETIYVAPEEHAAEGEEPHQGYLIAVEEAIDAGGGEEASPEVLLAAFNEAFAAADPAAGEGVFKKCAGCHAVVVGENKNGPYLAGVVGRAIDAVPDYDYSGALEQVGEIWDPEHLNVFLTNPKAAAPGTKMNFPGLRDAQDRADVIAYLATIPGG